MWVWKVLDIRHKVSRILTWKVCLSVVLSITDNSLGPEQKCENISLLKIASLFPFVQAPESDKRERNWQNMFIISPICYPAVDSLDVTTFSYCFWIVHTDFDTEGNYFLVLWNFIQHLTSFGFCLTKFWSSCKHFWTKIFFLYDPLLSKGVAHCTVLSSTFVSDNMIFSNPGCVSPAADRVLTSRGWLVLTSVTLQTFLAIQI